MQSLLSANVSLTPHKEILSTTLYVRLPHRPHDQPQPWQFGALPFALARTPASDKTRRGGTPGAVEVLREGHAAIANMPAAERLVLIVAASDVLLTTAAVPPLPPARLRLALPNLVEDALATDAQPCHIGVGPALDDGTGPARGARRRVLMVADRAWLRAVLDAFGEHKHRRHHVVPAQLCLPLPHVAEPPAAVEPTLQAAAGPSAVPPAPSATAEAPAEPEQSATIVVEAATAALAPSATLLEPESAATAAAPAAARLWQLTVRTGEFDGYGLLLGDDALAAWEALAPPGDWYADRDAAAQAPLPPSVRPANPGWPLWIAGAQACLRHAGTFSLDLAQFEFAQGRADRWNLRAWRLPLALAAGVLLVQVVGMNTQWLMLRSEQQRLQAAQTQVLKSAFPQLPVVVDPPLQMRRQVEQMRLASGRGAPEDFLPLADRFAQAARQLAPDALQALEYRGKTLFVTLKPGTDTAALRNAARQAGLQMDEDKNPAPDASTAARPAGLTGSRWTIKPGL